MLEIIKDSLPTLIGVFLGWFLNELSQFSRSFTEKRQKLRGVLFNLLEIHYIISKMNYNEFIDSYSKIASQLIKEKFPDRPSNFDALLKPFIKNLFASHIIPNFMTNLNLLEKNYENSVQTYSALDPVNAHLMSGRVNTIIFFNSLKQVNPTTSYSSDLNIGKDEIETIIQLLNPSIMSSLLTDLKSDIKVISWKISPWLWLKMFFKLKKLHNVNNQKEIKEQLKTQLDYLKNTIEQLNYESSTLS